MSDFEILTIVTATIAILVSIGGAFISIRAVKKSSKANKIANEANSIANNANGIAQTANTLSQESNEIAKEALSRSLIAAKRDCIPMIYGELVKSGTVGPYDAAWPVLKLVNESHGKATIVKANGRLGVILDFMDKMGSTAPLPIILGHNGYANLWVRFDDNEVKKWYNRGYSQTSEDRKMIIENSGFLLTIFDELGNKYNQRLVLNPATGRFEGKAVEYIEGAPQYPALGTSHRDKDN